MSLLVSALSLNRLWSPPSAVGSVVCAGYLLTSLPYPYAPVVGGLIAGLLTTTRTDQTVEIANAGLLVAVYMLPLGVGLAALGALTPVGTGATGVATIIRAMEGTGPRTVVFYGVFVWFLGVYSLLTAGASSTLVGVVLNRVR